MKESQKALDFACQALQKIAEKETGESYGRILRVLNTVLHWGGYRDKKILDAGCSIGLHAIAASQLGAHVDGFDKFTFPVSGETNPFQLTQDEFCLVQKAWKDAQVNVVMHDLEQSMPFDDRSYDLVVSNAVIDHLHGIHKKLLNECSRVLKPKGLLLITTPNLASVFKRIRFLIGRSPNWDIKDFYDSETLFTGHTREFTIKELVSMVESVGFHILSAKAMPTYFRWKWFGQPHKWPWIFAYLLGFIRPSFGDLIFLVAQKPAE